MNLDLADQANPIPRPSRWDRLNLALARDLGQRFDRLAGWVRNPLAVLILAGLVAALCGFCLHPRGFVVAIGLGALVVVGVAWPWVNLVGLRGMVAFDRSRAREGETLTVRLALRNRAPWGAWGLAIQAGSGDKIDAGLADLGGWRRTEVTWPFVPDRRGVYPTQPPRIASGFPFGLWEASRALSAAGTLVVWPRTVAVGPIPVEAGGRMGDGEAPRDRAGGSGDFLGVRAYRRGDSLRRVHWPQTARIGQMVICELQSHAVPRVQVVLDTDPDAHAGSGATSSLEWAIRVAASFVDSWLGGGAEVDLILAGGPPASPGRSVASRRTACLDALARLDPTSNPLPLADLLDQPACRRFAGGLRVVITTDRALARLGTRSGGPTRGAERFVVLQAGAFDPELAVVPEESLPLTPWIWVDDPEQVARQLRRAGKEVSRAS